MLTLKIQDNFKWYRKLVTNEKCKDRPTFSIILHDEKLDIIDNPEYIEPLERSCNIAVEELMTPELKTFLQENNAELRVNIQPQRYIKLEKSSVYKDVRHVYIMIGIFAKKEKIDEKPKELSISSLQTN